MAAGKARGPAEGGDPLSREEQRSASRSGTQNNAGDRRTIAAVAGSNVWSRSSGGSRSRGDMAQSQIFSFFFLFCDGGNTASSGTDSDGPNHHCRV